MTFTVSAAGMLMLVGIVLLTVALVVLRQGRPWELRGVGWMDRLRIAIAVVTYDTWLSFQGVRGPRRRDLCGELRVNVWDAATRGGARQALDAVGPLRVLARESVGPRGPRPNWLAGFFVALVALELTLAAQFMLMTVWVDAAQASGAPRVEGSLDLVPGMRAFYSSASDAEAMGVGMESGPAPLVVALAVFLVVARPWRLVRSSVPA